jgi:hypothetical protein
VLAVANAVAAVALHLGTLRVPPTVERSDLVPGIATTGVLVFLLLVPLRLGIRRRYRRGESRWPGGWRTPAVVLLFAYGVVQAFWSTASQSVVRGELRVYSAFLVVFALGAALDLLPRLTPSRDR